MRKSVLALVVSVVSCGLVSPVFADGFLVIKREPRISGIYTVTYHHVDIKVDNQVSKVRVTQGFSNPTNRILQAEYFFPLPEDAAIDNFVLMVDGKEMSGKLMGKDEARKIYEDIVRRRKDPALLEYMGRGLFKTSVFPIPPGAERQVNVSYTKLCKRDGNTIELSYPLATEKHSAQPLNDLLIKCRITHDRPITTVYSPTHEVNVTRPGKNVVEVTLSQHHVLPQSDFSLVYGVSDSDVGMSVLSYRPDTSEAGYFLLLASPKVDAGNGAVIAKSIIFVLDKSGSMTGKKIEQAKSSLRFVIKNLRDDDTFNIITYDSDITSFKPELQRADSGTISEALTFVNQISAGGSTNIDGALRTAMDMLKVPDRPSYVIFLTDGLPTAGEQREAAIVSNCAKSNRVRARLMGFGVGNDVNARLMDKLATGNFGASHYVRPTEDIEAPVAKLFSKLSSPVLSRLSLSFAGLDQARTYPSTLPDLFVGNQLVVVGRYHTPGEVTVRLAGRTSDREQTFTHRVRMDDRRAPYARSFIEKLWAERRVGYLIDEIDLHGQNKELVAEIVQLSTKYGILTPYTSFLADERTDLAALSANSMIAAENLVQLDSKVSGIGGVGQRVQKAKRKGSSRPAAFGYATAGDYEGEEKATQTVFNLANKTFYHKKGRWLDSTITPKQEQQAIRVVQFSDDYFALTRRLSSTQNQYLTMNGELLLNLDGATYLIVPEGK